VVIRGARVMRLSSHVRRGLSPVVRGAFLLVGVLGAVTAGAAEIPMLLGRENFFFHEELYRYDTDWDEDWYGTATGFRTTVGSVSTSRFLLDLDLKLRQDLGSHLWFEYRLRREESWLWDRETQLGAFGARWGSWRAGVTGLLKSEKGYNIAGIHLGLEPAEDRRVTCRVLWPNLYFNDKGPGEEPYQETPLEVQLEGVWTWPSVSVFGEVRAQREWVLESADRVESGRDSSGRVTLLWRPGATEYGLEVMGRDYRSGSESLDPGEVEEVKELRLARATVSMSRPLAPGWQMTARLGAVSLQGEDVDEDGPGGMMGEPFAFTLSDWIGTVEVTRSLSELDRLRGGLTLGTYDVDPGLSESVEPISGSRVFLKLEYSRSFGSRGDIVVGGSFNVTQSVFGGGNVRLRILL